VTKQKAVGVLGIARCSLALLALVALGVGFDRDVHTGDSGNFLFYFTNLSNLFAAYVFLTGGIAGLRGRPGVPDLVRGAAVLYLVITGLVYWTLLASQMNAATIQWQNDIVHGVMPGAIVLDWLLAPPSARLSPAKATRWMAFPILYLAVSLIRGPIVEWWPYDFLDPREPGGYLHVTTWSVIVTAVFVFFMVLIVLVGNLLGARRSGYWPGAESDASAEGSGPGKPSSERNLSSRSA